MNDKHRTRKILLAWFSGLVLVAGCWAPVAMAQDAAGEEQQETEAETPAVLDEPMDGSSVEAFEKDLERVRVEAGEKAYYKLNAALDYLLFYRIELRKDRAKLYEQLDGKSPREIIQAARNT